MLSKLLVINDSEYIITKSGVINGEVVIEIRNRKTKELDLIKVNKFTLKNHKPIQQNFFNKLVKRLL